MLNCKTIVEIYGNEYKPEVGSYIEWDGARSGHPGALLEAGDDYCDSGYAGSQFRVDMGYPVLLPAGLPINIEITGRTMQHSSGRACVRIKITWVQDCEPDTTCGGWLFI